MAPEPAQDDLFPAEPPGPVGRRRNVRIGTCSWTDPSLIKAKTFYPRGCSSAEQRLAYYASQFPIVEVDSSFFALPDPVHAQLWAQRTPSDFEFNVKAFRLLTGHQTPPEVFPPDIKPHLPPLSGRKKNYYYADLPSELRDEIWFRFLHALRPLQAAQKLRAVHFQFAPWVNRTPAWRAHVEHCVERIYVDIRRRCAPRRLSVQARYTRRGGLDINPWRSSEPGEPPNPRAARQ